MQRKSLNSYKSEDKLYTDKYLAHSGIQTKQLAHFEPRDNRKKQNQLNQNKYFNEKNQGIIPKYQWNRQWKGIDKEQQQRNQNIQQSLRHQFKQLPQKRYQSRQHKKRQQTQQHLETYPFNHQFQQQQERYQWRQHERIDARQDHHEYQNIDVMQYEQQQYIQYLEGLSIGELERELVMMREKERGYYKLNHQLKMLQKKSKMLNEETKHNQFTSTIHPEDEEIANIKAEIQNVIAGIKAIINETKIIKTQSVESKQQLKSLQTQLGKLKQQNFHIQNNINEQSEKLFTQNKTNQHIQTAQIEKQSQVDSIRNQIKLLEKQAILLQKQLTTLEEQKQARSNKKHQLNNLVFQLHQNLLYQSQHQNQLKLKLKNTQQLKHQLEQQLKLLREKQTQLITISQAKNQDYHKLIQTTQQSQREIINLKDQLFIVQKDINELNNQYIYQTDLLKQQETQNTQINNQFDALTQQATQLWNSVTQLIQIHSTKSNQLKNNQLFNPKHNTTFQNHNSSQQLKFKALKLWNEIQQLIQINHHS